MKKSSALHIKSWYRNSGERSRETVNNIVLSLFTRAASIIAQLLIVPLTLNYLNSERYGIWLTLSSIIGWVTFLDLGLGNGFRNRFTEAKAANDTLLARQYLSTTYCVISIVIFIALAVILLINTTLDWSALLHVDAVYRKELTFVFAVVVVFTCLNMVANIFSSMLAADQKVGYASIIQAVGQYLSLLVIFLLSKTTEGSLTSLAVYYSGIPCIVMFAVSGYMFLFTRYRIYRPGISHIRLSLTKSIMNLGVQFFIIQLCMLAIFQIVNIVISRELGPESVTQYNISNKYFNIVLMTAIIIITPFWSAFTDAYAKKDFQWMKSAFRKIKLGICLSLAIYLLLLAFSGFAYRIWIGNSLTIAFTTSLAMMFQVICQTYGSVNMYLVNGIGTVRLQTIIYLVFAIIAWPLFTFSCQYGLPGIILVPGLVYLTQGISAHIQIHKLLNHKTSGIWAK